jgi:peptide/nickel transport system permease protein
MSAVRSFLRRFARHRVAVVAAVVLVVLVVLCAGASWIAPYDQNHQDLALGPVGPSSEHWFGTDQLGRDQLSELLFAGQITLEIGFAVALLATLGGSLVGAVAGYGGRWVDELLMRLTDLFLVVPTIAVLAIAVERFGNDDLTIVIALAAVGWMYVARVVRAEVIALKAREYIDAARSSGASASRIVLRHILPNVIGPIVVNATLAVAAAVIVESTLSFLGFGIQAPDTSWGRMLADARGSVGTDTSYLLWFPGLALLLTILAVNYVGEGLRGAFDVKGTR